MLFSNRTDRNSSPVVRHAMSITVTTEDWKATDWQLCANRPIGVSNSVAGDGSTKSEVPEGRLIVDVCSSSFLS